MNAEFPIVPAADAGPVVVNILPEATRFNLRIEPSRLAGASAAFGLPLPAVIGQGVEKSGRRALCLGPDEWVLSAGQAEREVIASAFAALYAEMPHCLVDISDREIAVTLEGGEAATLLSIGCPADVESFASGTGARTVFDGVQIMLHRNGPDRFTLEVWRSFLPHVLGLIEIANRELAAGL